MLATVLDVMALLVAAGSSPDPVTALDQLSVPACVVVPDTVIVAEAPLAIEPSWQVTRLLATAQVPTVVAGVCSVTVAGAVSVYVVVSDALGPPLVTVALNAMVALVCTVAGAVDVTPRSVTACVSTVATASLFVDTESYSREKMFACNAALDMVAAAV